MRTNDKKADLLAAIAAQDPEAASGLAKATKPVLLAWLAAKEEQAVVPLHVEQDEDEYTGSLLPDEEDETEEEDEKRGMAATLRTYREKYVDTVTYANRLSKNNGDDVAKLLAGLDPLTVVRLAERVLSMTEGELVAKYALLNPGQKRMNAGNRIRAAHKRGDVSYDSLKAMVECRA